ncbi:LysM peptidoglycan-binding domain-containing protein [Cysteiniphilum sp. JM-1]|uniref:LysM peptidoglycan-binding domain-containing protein n=1 Tax=Cysteiniphilum sp. JM-1 TaxID=2610891 RepID=UPI00168D3F65|nr:LysM peptidoglycan-binding domain-containing protein [Cysteiniphilum sp. JM-1]
MQKKLYIVAANILLLAGCAQFASQNKEPAVITSTQAGSVIKDKAAVAANDTTPANKVSTADDTTKVIEAVGAPQAKAQEISAVASAVDNDKPVTYKVEIGDSLYSIARKNNISMTCLSKTNKITDPNRLAAGQTLIIPKPTDC